MNLRQSKKAVTANWGPEDCGRRSERKRILNANSMDTDDRRTVITCMIHEEHFVYSCNASLIVRSCVHVKYEMT